MPSALQKIIRGIYQRLRALETREYAEIIDGVLLLPSMTTAERVALTAVNGMVVYDTTVGAVFAYESGAWANL